jgi:tetratricopeptide (TPR) repeat protein
LGLTQINELLDRASYSQALKEITELPPEDMLEGLILKGRILTRQGDLNGALTAATHAIEECQSNGTIPQIITAFISLGYAQLTHRNLPELDNTILQVKELFSKTNTVEKHWEASIAYLEGYLLFLKGKLEEALTQIEKSLIINQALNNMYNMVEALTAIGFIHIEGTGKYNLGFDYFQRSINISENLGNATALAHSLNRMGCYYSSIDDHDTALSYFERSLALYQEVENNFWIMGLNNNIAVNYMERENYNLALHYLQRNLENAKQHGYEREVAFYMGNIGGIHIRKGVIEPGITQLERSLKIMKARGEITTIVRGGTLLLLSMGFSLKGDFDLALHYAKRNLELSKEVSSTKHTAWGLFFLSHIHTLQGDPQIALEFVTRGLKLFTELDDKTGIAWCLSLQGVIYKDLGNLNQAQHYLLEGWELFQKAIIGGSLAWIGSYSLFELILLAQESNDIDKAKKYLVELQNTCKTNKSKLVLLRVQFAEAIVLAISKRAVKKFQAQEILQSIIDGEIISYPLTILAMLNLCELLILEMKMSETAEELLQEVTQISTRLYEIANHQNSPLLRVMALILKTKLALVHSGDFEEASLLLSEAKQIAEKKKLGTLLTKVKIEQETVQAELDKWNDLIQRKASIKERVEQAQIAGWLGEAKKIQEAWVRPSVEIINQ